MNFYYLLPPDDSVVATISDECDIDFIDELQTSANDILFNINSDANYDILANDLGWPLVSKRVKDVIDSVVTDKSHYIWHKVIVASPCSRNECYVPQFLKTHDILDTSNSIFAEGGFVVKACIEPAKAYGIGIFPIPGSDSRIIISHDVNHALRKSGINTGHFEAVSTTPPQHH
ncbi:imm11 family protein [Shewanella japonica]|uniref:Immunity MXAN-0049 protein domain-containing protein n=1 Tax=Shewanella japonica TaxID=93973 RepID=A0ABM6JQK7_9GAMM|nr:DUF1629 domain-containing protein [Shewanella japonica]ARD24078.1 hypothetical protein SJ2017_3845 [Shewanella japonica]